MGSGIEPGHTAAHDLHIQLTELQIMIVDRSDFELPSVGRPDAGSDVTYLVIVEIKPRHRIIGLRPRRLFFDRDSAKIMIECADAVTLRILHMVSKYGRTAIARVDASQRINQIVPEKYVIAEEQCAWPAADEAPADDECLSQPVGAGLHF